MAQATNSHFSSTQFKSPAFTGLFLFLLLMGFILTSVQVQHERTLRGRELVAPPEGLEHFDFGFRESMADLFWVRALQDFDYCEQVLAKHLCHGKGWLFRTLNVTTDLDPQFRIAYSAGGVALSVIISDYEGASKLFQKGVERFPNDWVILYKAAYHVLYEEKDIVRSAALMEKAAKSGAPDWVYILAGRLYTDAGKQELGQRVLADMQTQGLDEKLIERLRQKLQEATKSSP